MNWTAVLEDKSLQDLPYKIETNRHGQIVMSPASNRHGIYQAKIAIQLDKFGGHGTVISECSVETDDGIKVSDVAWASPEFMRRNGDFSAYPEAPEVCVEIISPSNSSIVLDENASQLLSTRSNRSLAFRSERDYDIL